jgi:hypothetical protein
MAKTNIVYGVGKRCGPRKGSSKVPKDEIIELITILRGFGLGCSVIGRMLGYSPSMIHLYQRDYMGLKPITKEEAERDRAKAMLALFPPELRARIERVKVKSEYAHEAVRNRNAGTGGRYTHALVDEDEEVAV